MKILGIGIDIIKNKRIGALIKDKMFIKRTFGKKELLGNKKKQIILIFLQKDLLQKRHLLNLWVLVSEII